MSIDVRAASSWSQVRQQQIQEPGQGQGQDQGRVDTSASEAQAPAPALTNNLNLHHRQPAPDMNFAAPPNETAAASTQQQSRDQQFQHHHLQQQQQQQQANRPYPPQQFHQQSALSHPQQQLSQLQLQQQQQHHQYAAMNGSNGANMAAMPAPAPTPAGHQAELNYIYGMVEELSRQLADNRRVTEDIVSGLGRVRNRARSQALANDELIASASDELSADKQNLDALISILSEALEKANHSRDANANLLAQYANALALMLKQFHEYKAKHVADVAVWHRSYRSQLDEARQENSRLREQIWAMQTHAGRANDSLRGFRRRYDDDAARWARRVDDTAARQELRFWKRMAMPELEDDDPYWSADDDIIDAAEKDRQHELENRAVQEQMLDSQAEDEHDGQPPQLPQLAMLGGIAMQRDESVGRAMPVPPPRPLSAASSTGSTGQ